ncbi:MIP family channel protein [SAR202 cluster bacterium AD-802-E10_MRT_200m]|nr:MIP family channel protein [SAR202 cluster bacterium AD-802-E10_MRT_200m]
MKNSLTLRFLAETIGTFGLVFFAAGSVMVDSIAQGILTLIGLALCSGLAVMTMIYTFGPISGAHINPAVTFGFALTGRLPWKDAGVYVIAQITGAVIAALLLRATFGLVADVGGHAPSGSPIQSFVLEISLTFFLMAVIIATTVNHRQFGSLAGLVIGGTVALCIVMGGPISGGSMNPARSFGPALVAWNWGSHWVYWIGPLVGSSLGGILCSWLLKHWTQVTGKKENEGNVTEGKRVLFACVHNSGRSQMAEAFARKIWGNSIIFESAGTDPADRVNPLVVKAMEEKGIKIGDHTPRLLTQEIYDNADRVITMGCSISDVCASIDETTEDWALEDPEGKTLEDIRVIRNEIEVRIKALL